MRKLAALMLTAVLFSGPLSAQKIAAGSWIEASLEQSLSSEDAITGQPVTARVGEALKSGPHVVLPAGSRFHGRVESVQSKSDLENGWIRLIFKEVSLPDGRKVPIEAFNSFRATDPRRAMTQVFATGAGAIIGAAAGGKSARMTGLLGGALAGFLIASNKQSIKRDLRLRAGQSVRLRVSENWQATPPSSF